MKYEDVVSNGPGPASSAHVLALLLAITILTPFIDTTYFNFSYGQTSLGERLIDSRYASSTLFVVNPAETGYPKLFGLNLEWQPVRPNHGHHHESSPCTGNNSMIR